MILIRIAGSLRTEVVVSKSLLHNTRVQRRLQSALAHAANASAEKITLDIPRATGRRCSAEEKIRIVLEKLRGEFRPSPRRGLR